MTKPLNGFLQMLFGSNIIYFAVDVEWKHIALREPGL